MLAMRADSGITMAIASMLAAYTAFETLWTTELHTAACAGSAGLAGLVWHLSEEAYASAATAKTMCITCRNA